MKSFVIIKILIILIVINDINSVKLNYPRVLLPIFEKISINFTLEVVEKGCYKWVSSRQDLISISPIYDYNECSYQAVVTPISREKQRNTAIVLAENLNANQVLRCDVILDMIDQLGVLTTTRELFLDEAPETFELWAQDSQGNAFTTLEGIEFNWQILSQYNRNVEKRERNSWHDVLKFLTFTESTYHSVPKTVEKFEQLGLKGYMVLLEGINTGSAKVNVRLPHAEYQHVPVIEVDITVLANIILDPIDACILVGDTIEFRILQLKQGKLEDITINNQYYLEIEDTKLATINGNIAKGNVLGKTSVILRDRNVPSESGNLMNSGEQKASTPRAALTIGKADKLSINLLPYNNWATIYGEKHDIALDLYTHDNQKIILGPNYKINSHFDEYIFVPLSRNPNGSRVYGEANAIGTTAVHGQFEKLTTKEELSVYKSLELYPKIVCIPYDATRPKASHTIAFHATGGDGKYTWTSLNENVITITQSGIAETFVDRKNAIDRLQNERNPLALYEKIKVAMTRNPNIYETAEIIFIPPYDLKIVKYHFETAIGQMLSIYVALYTGDNEPFPLCQHIRFELNYSTNDIFNKHDFEDFKNFNNADQLKNFNACRHIRLRAMTLGTTKLIVSFTYQNKKLQDEVTLTVYEPLSMLNPVTNEIVLPIGTSRNIIYQKGPQKVFNVEAELVKSIEYDERYVKIDQSLLSAPATTVALHTDKHILNVLCHKLGHIKLKFKIYNSLQASTFLPNIIEYITNIHCVKPRFINLYTMEKMKETCPMKLKKSLMHMKRTEDNLEVIIEISDSKQRLLQNITSLLIDFNYNFDHNKNAIDTIGPIEYRRETENDMIAGVPVPLRDYIITALPKIQSNFKIKAIVSGYNKKVLQHFGIKSEQPEFGIQKTLNDPLVKPIIENELDFLTVNSTLLPFNKLTIFMAIDKPEIVPISQGSGSYDIQFDSDVVQVELDATGRQLIITPYRIGQVKIVLTDRCLVTDPSYLHVSIVSIGRIDLHVADRVEKGHTLEAIVKLYDTNDHPLSIDFTNFHVYGLHGSVFSPIILSIVRGDENNLKFGEIRYDVTGLDYGETKLVFTSKIGEQFISSPALPIQVFSSLKLYPSKSVIVIGASLQIYAEGGPHPDMNIVYSVQNENIISMESGIALGLKLGSSKIVGKCIGVNPANGQQMVFSEDSIEIQVVPLEKFKIQIPLEGIKAGAIMPAAIWGVPNISPLVLGTIPNIKITWSTNQPDIISIMGIFSDAGIEYTDVDSISVRIKALNPGKANIKAVVQTPSITRTISVEINVFKIPELIAPKHITSNTILVPPRTQLMLKANVNDMEYKLEDAKSSIIRVTRNGELYTNEAIGRDVIIGTSRDQTLSIPIEVKNTHYILATLHSESSKLKQSESIIPRGMNLLLKVTLHDNLGNEFTHNFDNVMLEYKLSKKDVANIHFDEQFTMGINLPRDASGMLVISLRDTSGIKFGEDYIKLSIKQSKHSFPTQIMYSVGDIICFDSPLTQSANWISSDDSIITVDNILGVARVLSSRSKHGDKINIINGHEQYGNIKYDLEIRDSDTIEFHETNDIFNGEIYHSKFIIKNHLQIDKQSNVVALNTTRCLNLITKVTAHFFTCKLSVNEMEHNDILKHLNAQSIFDKQSGTYACEIYLQTSISEFTNLLKNIDITLDLEVTLINGIRNSMTLKLVPAVKVSPLKLYIEQLSEQHLTITGLDKILQKLEITSSDKSHLDIEQIDKSPGQLQYKVKLYDRNYAMQNELSVNVYSPLTLQTIAIPLQSTNLMQKCTVQPLSNVSNIIMNLLSNFGLIISTVVIVLFTIYAWFYCMRGKRSDPQDFSPFLQNTNQNRTIPQTPVLGPAYPSPYLNNSNVSTNSGRLHSSHHDANNGSPIYGDSTLISPQKRLNRRYL